MPRPARRRHLAAACWLLAFAAAPAAAGGAHDSPAPTATTEPAPPLVLLPDLRQRIDERLAQRRAARAAAATPTLTVAVKNHAAEAPGAAASAHEPPPRRTSAPRPPPHRPPAHPPGHWSYEGEGGPPAWGALEPGNAACRSGQRQSPIDIRDGIAVDLEAIRFDYQPGAFSVIDNGHTVQVDVAPGSTLAVGGRRYALQQFHFHRPSEERIDGRQFAMVMHLVHRSDDGRLAVVAVLLDEGPAHPVVQQVWNHLPLEKHEPQAAPVTLDPAALLPAERRYYTYMGSLTTPPCTEGVLWLVMQQPATLSPAQQAIFARLYPMNARPVQATAGRLIKQSN